MLLPGFDYDSSGAKENLLVWAAKRGVELVPGDPQEVLAGEVQPHRPDRRVKRAVPPTARHLFLFKASKREMELITWAFVPEDSSKDTRAEGFLISTRSYNVNNEHRGLRGVQHSTHPAFEKCKGNKRSAGRRCPLGGPADFSCPSCK